MDIKKKRLILATVFSLIWAALVVADKYALNSGIEPLPFAYQRLLGAAAISIVPLVLLKPGELGSLKKSDALRLAGVGMIGTGLGAIAMFYGLKYSTSVNYGFLVKTTVVFSILLAGIFLKEELTSKKAFYALILLLGAYLISTGGKTLVPHIGDLIILLAAFLYSSANIIAKPLMKKHSPEISTFFRLLFGALTILIFTPFMNPGYYIIQDTALVAITGILSFLTIYLLNKLIEISSISYMTMMTMMFSVFTAIMGYIIFGETMNIIQILGTLLILLSVARIHNSNI